ncbi:MAG: energy transducer TonB [Deltaproteobacteria bacterium]|nr:energy transducer TonB [Deltaproteobacteria bacterium]
MLTKTLAAMILVTGCATTQRFSSTEPTGHGASLVLDTAHARSDEAAPWFPALAQPAALPHAQALRQELVSFGEDRYSLGVRVCVGGSGAVDNVELTDSSGIATLDAVALRDIKAWQFVPFAAPAALHTCKPFTISYRPQ